jgi:hypothetical protein
MPEHTGSVAVQEREAACPPPPGGEAAPGDPMAVVSVHPEQKCPYLAGRPPHGSHHLWPSGVNVCYARGSGNKPYGPASKGTQQRQCFCGGEVFERCADYERAQAGGVTLPAFDGSGPSSNRGGSAAPTRHVRRERHKRRRRRSAVQKWMESSAKPTFVCACWVLLAMVAYWLVMRSL